MADSTPATELREFFQRMLAQLREAAQDPELLELAREVVGNIEPWSPCTEEQAREWADRFLRDSGDHVWDWYDRQWYRV